jgi:hypothetical protein
MTLHDKLKQKLVTTLAPIDFLILEVISCPLVECHEQRIVPLN